MEESACVGGIECQRAMEPSASARMVKAYGVIAKLGSVFSVKALRVKVLSREARLIKGFVHLA